MFDKEKARELAAKYVSSRNESTRKLAEYLLYALDTITYYKGYIDGLKKSKEGGEE